MKIKNTFLLTLFLVGTMTANAAEWSINNAESQLSFISTKKQHVSEVHHFTKIEGTLSDTGAFELNIPLSSVETGVDVRNDRMHKMLFEVAQFPSASLTAQIDMQQVAKIAVAQSVKMDVEAVLNLHGVVQKLTLTILVSKLTDSKLLVVSANPVVVNADDFSLAQGVEALREVAGLPSISHAVPVSFYLTLNANN